MSNKYKKSIKNVALFLMNIFPIFLVHFVFCMWVLALIKIQPLPLVSNIMLIIIFSVIFIRTITSLVLFEIKDLIKKELK